MRRRDRRVPAGISRVCRPRQYPAAVYPTPGIKLPRMGSAKALQTRRYQAFRERLRQARLDAGLSQVEVAARIGKPQTYEIGRAHV